MRIAVGLLASLSVVGLSQALATEPTPPSAPPQAQQPATASTPSAPSAPAAPAAPATPAAAAATAAPAATATDPASTKVTVTGSKPGDDLSPEEKKLISSGYTLERHGDQKLFCKREETLGTRFARKNCRTSDAIFASTQHSKDATGDIQRGYSPPPAGK